MRPRRIGPPCSSRCTTWASTRGARRSRPPRWRPAPRRRPRRPARPRPLHARSSRPAPTPRPRARRRPPGEDQHAALSAQGEDARHLGRAADLLNAFRTNVVADVGPRLQGFASSLFAELTDNEYDELTIDPETYGIKIRDAGVLHGLDRFSGSETDLANLALRVAISEQVRFQSGGAVGLLVLDEVFGPLDDDRKDRMLLALERLRARFRQILVITHDDAIKAQLPIAIEVLKVGPRRATARVIASVQARAPVLHAN